MYTGKAGEATAAQAQVLMDDLGISEMIKLSSAENEHVALVTYLNELKNNISSQKTLGRELVALLRENQELSERVETFTRYMPHTPFHLSWRYVSVFCLIVLITYTSLTCSSWSMFCGSWMDEHGSILNKAVLMEMRLEYDQMKWKLQDYEDRKEFYDDTNSVSGIRSIRAIHFFHLDSHDSKKLLPAF